MSTEARDSWLLDKPPENFTKQLVKLIAGRLGVRLVKLPVTVERLGEGYVLDFCPTLELQGLNVGEAGILRLYTPLFHEKLLEWFVDGLTPVIAEKVESHYLWMGAVLREKDGHLCIRLGWISVYPVKG